MFATMKVGASAASVPFVVWVGALTLGSSLAAAQDVRVELKVTAEETLKAELLGHLGEGLKRLPAVSIGAEGADFIISVIAIKVVTRSSKDMGLAASVVITAPYASKLREFCEARLSLEVRAEFTALTVGAAKSLAHWIEIASVGDLQKLSTSIIQAFVQDVLSPARKAAALAAHSQSDAKVQRHRSR